MQYKISKMKDFISNIKDTTLKRLIAIWSGEDDPFKKLELKRRIIKYVEQKERDTFFARFILGDFDSWNEVLNDEEGNEYHSAGFFEEYLIEVLSQHPDGIRPAEAIKEVIKMVYDQLHPGDFKITKSKRIRYDSMIRSLYEKLKNKKLIMSSKDRGIKYWKLMLNEKRERK